MNSTQPAKLSLLQQIVLLEQDSADHDIMGGIKTALDKIQGGWRSDYGDIKSKYLASLKKLTDAEQKKLTNFSARTVDKLIDDVTKPIDVEPLMAVLYSKKEISTAYLMFATLSAAASEMHKQFLLDAVTDGYITNAEAQEKIKNVQSGKFENVGANTVMKIKSNRSYLATVLKIDRSNGLFDPNAGAQLLDAGVATSKKNKATPEEIKAGIMSVYYTLLMIRRQLGTASNDIEKGGSTRKPPKEPQPVGGPKPAGKPAAAPAPVAAVTSAGAAMAAPKPAAAPAPAAPAPAQPAAAPAARTQGIDQETATEILTAVKQSNLNGQKIADKPELIAKAVAFIKALPKGTTKDDGEKIVFQRLLSGK